MLNFNELSNAYYDILSLYSNQEEKRALTNNLIFSIIFSRTIPITTDFSKDNPLVEYAPAFKNNLDAFLNTLLRSNAESSKERIAAANMLKLLRVEKTKEDARRCIKKIDSLNHAPYKNTEYTKKVGYLNSIFSEKDSFSLRGAIILLREKYYGFTIENIDNAKIKKIINPQFEVICELFSDVVTQEELLSAISGNLYWCYQLRNEDMTLKSNT